MSQEHNIINPIPTAAEHEPLMHQVIGSPESSSPAIVIEGESSLTNNTMDSTIPEGAWIPLPKQLCRAFLSGRPVCNRIPCKYFHGDEQALRIARESGHNAYRPADGKTSAIDEEALANMATNPDPKQVRPPDLLPGRVNSLAPKLDWPVDNVGRHTNANPHHLPRGSICATYYKGLACKLGVACPFLHSPPEYRMMDREVCAYHREGICGKGSQCAYFHGTDEERAKLIEQGARVYNAITKEAVPPSALAVDVREDPKWWEERPERLAELRQLRAAMPDSVPSRPPAYPGMIPAMYMPHQGMAAMYPQSPYQQAPFHPQMMTTQAQSQPGGYYYQAPYQQPVAQFSPQGLVQQQFMQPQLGFQQPQFGQQLGMQLPLQPMPIQVMPQQQTLAVAHPQPQLHPQPQFQQVPYANLPLQDPRYMPQSILPGYYGYQH